MAKHNDLVLHPSPWVNYLWGDYRDQAGQPVQQVEEAGGKRMDRAPDFMRELFASIYRPTTPKLESPAEGAEAAVKLHEEKEKLPEWKQLVRRCQGRQYYAGVAASRLSEELFTGLPERKESNEDLSDLQQRVDRLLALEQAGGRSKDLAARIIQAQKDLNAARKAAAAMAAGIDGTAMRQALRDAIGEAQAAVDEVEGMVEVFSWGNGAGAAGRSQSFDQTKEMADKVRASRKLQQIAEKAGRLRRIAAETQRRKSDYAREIVADVGVGADLPRVLPTELLSLVADDEDVEAAFIGKLIERKLGQYTLSGKEEKGRGPIIICEDESGSMSGAPDTWAKAVSMALLDIALRQRRAWAFIHFNTGVPRIDIVRKDGTGATIVPSPESTWPTIEAGMLGVLTTFYSGGTSFEAPLDAAVDMIRRDGGLKKADIVFVSDGVCNVGPQWLEAFLRTKEELQFKVLTVLIGSNRSVDQFSDQVFELRQIVSGHDEEFNSAAFSI